eukprot:GHVU01095045.1.p1 GENE.GHVU01095045.1~~GHVU01095045.1.p1  ORF type:complete len:153 (-),score=7.95 GHVU01095045.1:530-988(-)
MITDSQHRAAIWFDTLLNTQVWIEYNASAATRKADLITALTASDHAGNVIDSLKYLHDQKGQTLKSSEEDTKFLPLVMKGVETCGSNRCWRKGPYTPASVCNCRFRSSTYDTHATGRVTWHLIGSALLLAIFALLLRGPMPAITAVSRNWDY